jgi:MtN3 and saliva related transmembrane protein
MSGAGELVMDMVGVAAAVCSTTSFIPQLVKLVRERKAGAVSVGMYFLTVAAFALWSLYGLLLGSWPLIVSNLISLVLSSAILVLKLRYRGHAPAPPRGASAAPTDARTAP